MCATDLELAPLVLVDLDGLGPQELEPHLDRRDVLQHVLLILRRLHHTNKTQYIPSVHPLSPPQQRR
jgi:hypothetical protein